MTGFNSILKYFCFMFCLMLISTGARSFYLPQFFALNHWDDKLCMVDISGNQSTLVCNHEPLFYKALAGDKLPTSTQLISKCPKSWIKRKTCRHISVEQPVQLSNHQRLLHLAYKVYLSAQSQMTDFLHSSLDDLVEDGISMGLPLLAGYGLYPRHLSFFTIFWLLQAMNLVLSPVGDAAGDIIEYYQNGHFSSEGESEWSVRGIVSNKVEDHVKIIGYIITYQSTIIIQYLDNTYWQTSQDTTDGVMTSTSARAGVFVIKKGIFAYNTFQMVGHYNWINELSDTLSDIFTEMLFGQP